MKQAEQILELLQDTSFPQVVLLDGAWGSGKTHFINHNLKERLQEEFSQKVYFFSLYGVATIDDFRDKVISLSLTANEEASVFAKCFAKVVEGTATNMDQRGVGAVISGAAGAYKYKLYDELNNCVLILDDLERVADEKLIRNILGEAFNLAESRNIKVIVVANEEKLKCKDDIEKVFVDKYKFSFTHEEVVSILKGESDVLDEQLSNELLLHISTLDISNIRVLKRAISKFTRIQKEMSQIENIVLDQASAKILGDILRICSAKFQHCYSKEQIIESITTRVERQLLEDDDKFQNKGYEKLDEIFGDSFYPSNDKLIKYCCDGLYEFTDLSVDLELPIKRTLIDSMKSLWGQNQLSEDDFKKGVDLLEQYISCDNGKVDIHEWFSICDMYIHMLDIKVIKSKLYTREAILRLCDRVDIEMFELVMPKDEYNFNFSRDFFSDEVSKKFSVKSAELNSYQLKNNNAKLSLNFQESWSNVQSEIYGKMIRKPIFNILGVETIEVAFRGWSNEDIFQFARFIHDRYKFNNIEDYFKPELEALEDICEMIDNLRTELGFGLKVASLSDIYEYLKDAHTRIEKRILIRNES